MIKHITNTTLYNYFVNTCVYGLKKRKSLLMYNRKCKRFPDIPDHAVYYLYTSFYINHRAYPIDQIPARTRHAAAIIHMILNNLDPCVAQFPQELVTYGGNGQVFSNWAQVR